MPHHPEPPGTRRSPRGRPARLAALALAVAACSPGGSPSPTAGAVASDPASFAPPASTSPTATPAPARTPLPGYEDWQFVNPQAVRPTIDGETLVLELIGPRLWFNAERGVLMYREVTGDFRATATVRTAKASAPDAPPGADGTIQLAGLMARAEVPVENYVFIVAGSIGPSNGIETKTTTDSRSIYTQRAVGGGDADLRLCRQGDTFRLAWRPAGSDEAWEPVSTFPREDLPDTLQVGPNIYTDAVPDLVARFEDLVVEPLEAGADC
jgi:hypothetical protein